MRLFAEHKYGVRVTAMPTWREVFDKLGHSAVTIELLQIKPTNIVKINMNNPTDSNNKGWWLLCNISLAGSYQPYSNSLPISTKLDHNAVAQFEP